MPTTISSVYMSMPVPVPTVDPGPQYANDLNSCISIMDSHTHAPGQGQQITPAGINITTDLSFGGNNATNLRSTRYTAQGGALATGSDIGCTYVAGVDLYFNDVNGNQIRLTQSGGVAGTPGSIANLLFPASVTYVTGTQTFIFQSSTATAGNIDVGSVKIRQVLANANAITLSSPTSLAANYTLTFPPALPTAKRYLALDTSGNIYASSATTDWAIYPANFRGTVTHPTTGGIIVQRGLWRRVGDSMQIRYDFYQNGGGTAGSGVYNINLPAGALIDSTKISFSTNVPAINIAFTGHCGSGFVQTGTNGGLASVFPLNSSALSMYFYNSGLATGGPLIIGDANSGLNASSAAFSFQAQVPIQGWSNA